MPWETKQGKKHICKFQFLHRCHYEWKRSEEGGREKVSNWVFYAQSTLTVISGQRRENGRRGNWLGGGGRAEHWPSFCSCIYIPSICTHLVLLTTIVFCWQFWSLRDSLLLKPTRGSGIDQGVLDPATESNSCGAANPVTPTALSTTF